MEYSFNFYLEKALIKNYIIILFNQFQLFYLYKGTIFLIFYFIKKCRIFQKIIVLKKIFSTYIYSKKNTYAHTHTTHIFFTLN